MVVSFGEYSASVFQKKVADDSVFVTGNANKLKEVKAILAAGETKMEITSRAIDCKSWRIGSEFNFSSYSSYSQCLRSKARRRKLLLQKSEQRLRRYVH